jgi:hypothetical protein
LTSKVKILRTYLSSLSAAAAAAAASFSAVDEITG